MEIFKAEKARSNVLQVLKDHRCQPRFLYPAKLSITVEGKQKALYNLNRL